VVEKVKQEYFDGNWIRETSDEMKERTLLKSFQGRDFGAERA